MLPSIDTKQVRVYEFNSDNINNIVEEVFVIGVDNM